MSNFLSDFIGGFAGSLKQNIDRDLNAAKEDERWAARERARMELEKEYAAEVVARTAIEGNREVRYNKYGDPVGERDLTPEEIQELTNARLKSGADARAAVAGAGLAEFNLSKAPDAWALDVEGKRATIDAYRDDSDRGWRALDIQERELEQNGPMARLLYETDVMLNEAEASPPPVTGTADASSGLLSEVALVDLRRQYEQAKASGNPAEIRRVTALIKGRLGAHSARLRAQATAEGREEGSGGSMFNAAPRIVPVPGR